jgi:cyclopropane-fatty-acyl-phospholipid synthase
MIHEITEKQGSLEVDILAQILSDYKETPFSIRLPTGAVLYSSDPEQSRFTLAINDPKSLYRMVFSPSMLSLGSAYVRKEFDFEGDIEEAFKLGNFLLSKRWPIRQKARFALKLAALLFSLRSPRPKEITSSFKPGIPKIYGMERTQKAISYHYDLPTTFFQEWLDDNLVYSCAYFESESDGLDRAQVRKLDYICKKLRLKAGDQVLDVGCGWGALARHASKEYGAQVHGITLSKNQADYGRRRVAESGLEALCRIEHSDYRELEGEKLYDRIVSVGMAEHIPLFKLPEYFRRVFRLSKVGGVFVHHAIASSVSTPLRKGPSFMDKYIFPDTQLVPINLTLKVAEDAGFEVRDVENLREHYALTLRHWLRRFQKKKDAILRLTDENVFRKFQIYLAGCAHDFEHGRLNIFQTILVRPTSGRTGLPLTRDDIVAFPKAQTHIRMLS